MAFAGLQGGLTEIPDGAVLSKDAHQPRQLGLKHGPMPVMKSHRCNLSENGAARDGRDLATVHKGSLCKVGQAGDCQLLNLRAQDALPLPHNRRSQDGIMGDGPPQLSYLDP